MTENLIGRRRSGGKGNEVVRYSLKDKQATVISGGWPREVGEGWLVGKKAEKEEGGG